jgi:hypothetical protein
MGCGKRNANSAHLPGSLEAQTRPPCKPITRQTLYRPIPEPRRQRSSGVCRRENLRNSRGRCSGGKPGPWLRTAHSNAPLASSQRTSMRPSWKPYLAVVFEEDQGDPVAGANRPRGFEEVIHHLVESFRRSDLAGERLEDASLMGRKRGGVDREPGTEQGDGRGGLANFRGHGLWLRDGARLACKRLWKCDWTEGRAQTPPQSSSVPSADSRVLGKYRLA